MEKHKSSSRLHVGVSKEKIKRKNHREKTQEIAKKNSLSKTLNSSSNSSLGAID